MLGISRVDRSPGRVEVDLNALPVAFVCSEAEEGLLVVVEVEPILKNVVAV
jgi:hypothetical protein